jgi:3-oxoacyl-[acyl-carrier protein] reductase
MLASPSRPLVADLGGRVAIVTGSTSGIGRGTALVLAEAGAKVVVNGRRAHLVESAVREIRAQGGEAHGVVADLARIGEIDRLFAETAAVFGPVRILVNCAGLVDTRGQPLEFTDARVEEILAVNLRAPLLCALRAARVMAAHGGGCIVNVSSVGASQRAHHRNAIYDTAKGGLDGMTRALAVDLGPLGIRVNAIGPASTRELPPEGRGQDLPLRRGGTPEDQAWAILYLVSDAARFVTGQVLYVDGGLIAQLRSPGVEGEPA